MKKKLLIILILSLFIITACNNKEEIKKETTTKVKETISDIANISEENIKESYNYLKSNYLNYKDDEIYEQLIYHCEYLKLLGKYADNELTTLANNVLTYIEKSNKDNKTNVIKSLNKIDGKEENMIKEIYDNYLQLKVIKTIISNQTPIATGDANDKNMTNTENINKAIDYINKYIQNPLKNDEILEKTIYYSLYLNILGPKDHKITQLGKHMINYLSSFDKEEKDKALNLLNTITQDQNKIVNEFYNELTRNE